MNRPHGVKRQAKPGCTICNLSKLTTHGRGLQGKKQEPPDHSITWPSNTQMVTTKNARQIFCYINWHSNFGGRLRIFREDNVAFFDLKLFNLSLSCRSSGKRRPCIKDRVMKDINVVAEPYRRFIVV